VIRDLGWLLNTDNLESSRQDLSEYPEVARSVLNYGIPTLSGLTTTGFRVAELEQRIRQAIWDFEPRILRESVIVKASVSDSRMSKNAVTFEIQGELWAQPLPLHLYLQTDVDLETGNVAVRR
jgi:type VI secretion system protein ImpF